MHEHDRSRLAVFGVGLGVEIAKGQIGCLPDLDGPILPVDPAGREDEPAYTHHTDYKPTENASIDGKGFNLLMERTQSAG